MTIINASRRAFLRRSTGRVDVGHHMPWAVSAFLDLCSRCDDCARTCAPGIVMRGDGGFPSVDFRRGACTFCGDCSAACRTGALQRGDDPPWSLQPRFSDHCLSLRGITCRTCGDLCDARAIRFVLQRGGRAQPQADAGRCTGCGACVAPCPVAAINLEESR